MDNRINEQIQSDEIVLIDETGKSRGKIPISKAREIAAEKGMDLVEVATHASLPVCRLLNYKKFHYSKEKEKRKQRSAQRKKGLKEIRISLLISQHDLEVKEKRAKDFLSRGHKLKISLKLIGREHKFAQKAFELINNFVQDIDAEIEESPKREGSIIFALVNKK